MSKTAERLAALRGETSALNDGRPDAASFKSADEKVSPVTQEILDRLGHAVLWRIVVEPYIPTQRGMIATAPQVDDAERILSKVGRVVLVGSQAWKSRTSAGINLADEPHKPAIGDYVLHEMYAGTEINLTTGHTLRLLTDTECLMVVKDPSIIRGYL